MPDLIFADNDILLKLAEYDLLQKACAVLNTEPSRIRFQPATKYVILRMRDKASKGQTTSYSMFGLDRAIAFVDTVGRVTEAADLDWVQDAEGIDIGEAQLASWTVQADDSLLLTGDKRFIKALAGSAPAKRVFDGLSGRVICLEEILRVIMVTSGVDCIRKAVKCAPNCDKSISIAFGSGFDLPEAQVLDGIENLLRDIKTAVGDGWLKRL